jgi:hypothetical protein
MIKIDHVRMSFRNYSGNQDSAQRIAKLAMENLNVRLHSDRRLRGAFRTIDRAACEPVLAPGVGGSEQAIAELAAEQIWQTIRRHI